MEKDFLIIDEKLRVKIGQIKKKQLLINLRFRRKNLIFDLFAGTLALETNNMS